LSEVDVYNLSIIVGLAVGMVKKIKTEWLAINSGKMLKNFQIETGESREIGWS
jgi:hypothetical protein